MAEPLLSLLNPSNMKYVVPWETRLDFLAVYKDLYSYDVKRQESAIGRIAAWKSRAGNKLSVAIESSGMLMQIRMQHLEAERNGKLRQLEQQLCYGYSLALIRFVNHLTEKAQTKAVAQPVHLLAREFGIPEWIVRLRHDATHSALPCLDALASGTEWALNYLQRNFWEHQTESNVKTAGSEDKMHLKTPSSRELTKSPKTADIRRTFYEFQKIRYQKTKSGHAGSDRIAMLGKLQKLMFLNKVKFIKCLLEDGILVATQEQLQVFGVDSSDLITKYPPTIPQQVAIFWRPLLKRISKDGALSFLLQTALFSVTSEHGLRNYQLVAWIIFILANTSCDGTKARGKRKKHQEHDCFMRITHPIPTRALFSACIQNLNLLTVHLLRHLMDPDDLGPDIYAKLSELLQVQHTNQSKTLEVTTELADDDSFSSTDSESDTAYTLQDDKSNTEKDGSIISTKAVEDIRGIFEQGQISWKLCTDLIDWSEIPLGILPTQNAHRHNSSLSSDENLLSDDDDDDFKSKHRRRREREGGRGTDEEDDEEEDESDDADHDTHPKRSKLIVTDELLI